MDIDDIAGKLAQTIDWELNTYSEEKHGDRKHFIRDIIVRKTVTMLVEPARIKYLFQSLWEERIGCDGCMYWDKGDPYLSCRGYIEGLCWCIVKKDYTCHQCDRWEGK